MLRVTLIQVGKTKSPAIHELVLEYSKRISSSAKLEIVDVKTEDQLWAQIPSNGYTIALEVHGEDYNSEEFANFIENAKNQGNSHLVFLIGPAEGFSEYQKQVDQQISLSKMTFSHQTIRLLLLEQLYRAFAILEGKPFPR